MSPRSPIQCQSTALTSGAASTDARLLPILHLPGTQPSPPSTTLIPSSPANGITLRIIEGDLPHKEGIGEGANLPGGSWNHPF